MAIILPATPVKIAFLAEQLRQLQPIAIPTETVYGLAAHAYHDEAIQRIYQAKGRPTSNPLIIHYATTQAVHHDVIWNEQAECLAAHYWPGPLTLILPFSINGRVSSLARSQLATVAVRVPAHPVAQALLNQIDFPLAAPSANRSGQLSPVQASHVVSSLGAHIEWVLDGGACQAGIESTIIDLSTPKPSLLRAGIRTPQEISAILNQSIHLPNQTLAIAKSPGSHFRHYAPKSFMRWGIEDPIDQEALLAFGPGPWPDSFCYYRNLSPTGQLEEAAHYLFEYLHQLDSYKPSRIAVAPIPQIDIGLALYDRLNRAIQASQTSLL
jgi:L-threonylcarbamoyladenylate synthase